VKNLNCLDVETIEKNLKNETSEENDITIENNNENEQNKIPEIPVCEERPQIPICVRCGVCPVEMWRDEEKRKNAIVEKATFKNESNPKNDITIENDNENEQNKIPEIPGIIQDALNTSLVANEYLDGELAKYETWEDSNKSIRVLFESEHAMMQAKRKPDGVGQTTILKFLGGNWKQWIIQDALNTSLVANEYLDGELAKYETWESLNESIKTLSASVALSVAACKLPIPNHSEKKIVQPRASQQAWEAVKTDFTACSPVSGVVSGSGTFVPRSNLSVHPGSLSRRRGVLLDNCPMTSLPLMVPSRAGVGCSTVGTLCSRTGSPYPLFTPCLGIHPQSIVQPRASDSVICTLFQCNICQEPVFSSFLRISILNNSEHRSQRTGRKKDKMRNCYFRNLNFCFWFRVCFW
jgi:hypothetical protein